MLTILIISIFVLILGLVIVAKNLASAISQVQHGTINDSDIFSIVKRHLGGALVIVIGGLGTLISGIALIVQAFSK